MFLVLGGYDDQLSVTTKLPSSGKMALMLPFAVADRVRHEQDRLGHRHVSARTIRFRSIACANGSRKVIEPIAPRRWLPSWTIAVRPSAPRKNRP